MKKKETKNHKSIILITILVILSIIIAIILINRDKILLKVDYDLRKNNMYEAYQNRNIVKGVDNEFATFNDIGIKLKDTKIEGTKLIIQLDFKLPKNYLTNKLGSIFGISVFDENNNLCFIDENPFIYNIIEENKSVLNIMSLANIPYIYKYGVSKELGKEIPDIQTKLESLKSLEINGDIATGTYTYELEKTYSPKNLTFV